MRCVNIRLSVPISILLSLLLLAGTSCGQSVEQKSAKTKSHLKETIVAYNESLDPDVKDIILDIIRKPDFSQYGLRLLYQVYFPGLVKLASNGQALGYYLHYMPPAFDTIPSSGRTIEGVLLDERFLDHFSTNLAKTGIPPVAPPLTQEEMDRLALWKTFDKKWGSNQDKYPMPGEALRHFFP